MQSSDVVRLQSRLWNWGRWARPDSLEAGQCASAEHRFVSARPDDEAVQRSAQMPIDADDAERIEAAVCHLRCANDRKMLKMLYVDARTHREICRKLRVPEPLFGAFHIRVLGALSYRLEEVERGRVARTTRGTSCAAPGSRYINSSTI